MQTYSTLKDALAVCVANENRVFVSQNPKNGMFSQKIFIKKAITKKYLQRWLFLT